MMNTPIEDKTKRIEAAAKRALEEATERKKSTQKNTLSKELGGRNGPEPTRFGDWEKKGIVSDF
jgi:hypothetical protein